MRMPFSRFRRLDFTISSQAHYKFLSRVPLSSMHAPSSLLMLMLMLMLMLIVPQSDHAKESAKIAELAEPVLFEGRNSAQEIA